MEQPIRILILDDDASDAELIQRQLRKAGLTFEAEWAGDKNSFQRALECSIPDLILADYALPGFDGLRALALAKQRSAEIPVIIVSGTIGEERAIETLKAGATDYLLKDRLGRLDSVVRRALQEAATLAERKKAENSLRLSEKKHSVILESIHSGYWLFDLQGKILEVNEASCSMSGYSREEMLGMHVFDLEAQESREEVLRHIQSVRESGGHQFESLHRRKDGSVFNVEVRATYLDIDEGRLVFFVWDISDRKRAEAQLKELNEQLERRVAERTAQVQKQADQLRALAVELTRTEQRERKRLASVLHDHIQQLLIAARMQLEWIKRDCRQDNMLPAVKEVDSILKEALEASRTVTVELSPPVLHETGLAGGLRWLAARMLDKNKFNVNLSAGTDADPATEEVRLLLFECARELLLNVLKHAGVSEADLSLTRTIDGQLRVVVRDEGCGFDLERLQTRGAGDAAIGLFSIQERLAHIGGRVEIESALGRGSKVTLTVPIHWPAAAAGQPASGPAETADIAGRAAQRAKADTHRVLVVDDHSIVRQGLVDLLKHESDIEVVGEAADADQAIDLAEKLRPDVVVMDVNLGEVSGIEATRVILGRCPGTWIIGLSMHVDKTVADAMRDAGAAAFLSKGAPVQELVDRIRACCRG